MKTAELTGASLDYWVAKAEGHSPRYWGDGVCLMQKDGETLAADGYYRPSLGWAIGGPIIERERIGLSATASLWAANTQAGVSALGPTPLIAAMRCYVTSKFGEEVPDL